MKGNVHSCVEEVHLQQPERGNVMGQLVVLKETKRVSHVTHNHVLDARVIYGHSGQILVYVLQCVVMVNRHVTGPENVRQNFSV